MNCTCLVTFHGKNNTALSTAWSCENQHNTEDSNQKTSIHMEDDYNTCILYLQVGFSSLIHPPSVFLTLATDMAQNSRR